MNAKNKGLRRGHHDTFGTLIREMRKAQGISLRELARRISISPTYLSNVENDVSWPGPSFVERLYKALNPAMSLEEFYEAAGYEQVTVWRRKTFPEWPGAQGEQGS